MDATNRGKFRGVAMEDLEKWDKDPRWEGARSRNWYAYPIRMERSAAKQSGLRLAEGIPAEEVYRLGRFVCAKSPQSHRGPFRWAVDFLVPDGTPVLATRDGEVIEIQEKSESWGDGPAYRGQLNYLTIRHDNNELSQYCHLARNSVSLNRVQIGSEVKGGQQIALVGKTGWTDRDHLHFVVFTEARIGPFGFKSLRPKFIPSWVFF